MAKFIYALLVVGLMAAPIEADPWLDKMRSVSAEGPLYAYEMAFDSTDISATGKVDPSQVEGSRVEIYSPVEADWSDAFRDTLEEIESQVDGDIWCTEFVDAVPDNAERIADTADTVTYAFTPNPNADSDGMQKKLMKKLEGRITLAKSDGQVLAYSMRLPKPYKPAMVAKINLFDMQASCARATDDDTRTYIQTMRFNISGSAMMQDFNEAFTRKITKLLDPIDLD